MAINFSTVALGAQVLGSIFGGRSRKSALERYLRFIGPTVAQGQAAYKTAVGAGRTLLGQSMAALGKPSRLLRGQYEQAVMDTRRTGEAAARRARLYHAKYGNVGRARGEEMRTATETQRLLNELALGYGGAQEQYRRGTMQTALGSAGMMGDLARVGLAPLGQAAEAEYLKASVGGDMLSDIFGSLGEWAIYQDWKKNRGTGTTT